MRKTAKQLLGAAGEAHARRYLEAQGYTFQLANWRGNDGELDLIMRDGSELVFVEVKTRRGEQLGRAEESVTRRQQLGLLATAEEFIAKHPEEEGIIWRVDLVAITLDSQGVVCRLTHVENSLEC